MGPHAEEARGSSPWSRERHDLLRKLLAKTDVDVTWMPIAPRDPTTAEVPLSFAQERLWFLNRLEPDSPAYNVTLALPINGPVRLDALRAALATLVRRHEILRTTFPTVDGGPAQRIGPAGIQSVPVLDLSGVPERQRRDHVAQVMAQEARTPFDLTSGPVFRSTLIRLDGTDHLLLVCLHHIVIDGWSLGILLRDLFALYGEAITGQPASLPALPIQYSDFATWQRATLTADVLAELLSYWKRKLVNLPTLDLPADRPRPERLSFNGASEATVVPPRVAQALRDFSRREGVTLYMTLLAAFMVLLARYTGQTDVVVGSPIANRERPELAHLIGFFVNMLVLRTDLAGARTFRDVLDRVRVTATEAFAHQQLPFEKLVMELSPQRDPSRNPLFQVTFALEQVPPIAPAQMQHRTLGAVGIANQTTRFDLEALVTDNREAVVVGFTYNVDLFDAATIKRMLEEYRILVEAFAADLDQPLTDLPISPEAVLTTVEFLSQLRALDVKLAVEGDRLLANAGPGVLTSALRAELTRRKAEIVELLRAAAQPAEAPIQPIDRRGDLPVSLAQQRLWFLDQLDPNTAVYNIGGGLVLRGSLDAGALGRAVDEIVRRHESLRTSFPTVDGSPTVAIAPFSPQQLKVVDLRTVPATDRQGQLDRLLATILRKPFDLARGPLFHASLTQLSEEEHVLFFCMHHIVSDGWSMRILAGELAALYAAFANGVPSPLPPLPIQFVDYAHWERERLERAGFDGQVRYWTNQLRGRLPVLQLPADRPRPPVQTFNGKRSRFAIPPDLTNAIKELSLREGASLFMTLLAAFKLLLHRYTGDDDIIVGSPTAHRSRPELENLIGFFVNNLVLRTDLSGNPTFRELLSRVRRVLLSAHANQDVPFDRLVELLRPERNVAHAPLFQVMFNSPTLPLPEVDRPGSNVKTVELEAGIARFDLTVEYYEETASGDAAGAARWKAAGIRLYWEFNTDLFDPATISLMHGHYVRLLEAIVANPDERIATLPLLRDEEVREQLREWNATAAAYDRNQCVHQLFETQARDTPNAISVVCGNEQLTYADLERHANRLARHLQRFGVRPGVLVGIALERSVEMVVGILAVLKVGGAYVPLDPTYPPERLRFMLEDSRLGVVITQRAILARLPAHGAKTICVDTNAAAIGRESAAPVQGGARAGDRAYVIYTSGSTGKPKGVEVEHRSVVNFLNSMRHTLELGRSDRLLSVTTLSFDIAGLELYLPLVVGARIVLATRAEASNAARLLQLVETSKATVMQATPATWRLLLEAEWQGSPGLTILCGGEAMPRELADQLLPRGKAVWNLYGPTEATIWSTLHRVEPGVGSVPIGRPIGNTQVYILDGNGHPVPVGVTGELYLGGDGVARGYLNRPELTAQRFVPDPFSPVAGARVYRTGDLARYRPGGVIEWLGRTDGQTKIRGYRIELGEIEGALADFPGVKRAVVLLNEAKPGDQRLVAYVIPAKGKTIGAMELQTFLRARLPDYMVPSSYLTLDALPLTPNGKVDRRALPAPDGGGSAATATFVAPRTETERLIASVWAEVLGVAKVGLHDNFFDLGGHSLLIVRVHSRIQKQMADSISLLDLFHYPTVAALAERLTRGTVAPSFERARERALRQQQA